MKLFATGKIRQQLIGVILIILMSLVAIAAPLIHYSYRSYQETNRSLQHIHVLKILVDLCNQISGERSPSNLAMTHPNHQAYIQILQKYRQDVDHTLKDTAQILNKSGYPALSQYIHDKLHPQLSLARTKVDFYLQNPQQQNTQTMYAAILSMFRAWDQSYAILKQFYYETHNQNKEISDYFTVIFLLTELRDQAGRVASNITPAMSFSEKIPDLNLDRSEHNAQNILYLWKIIESLAEPELHTTTYQKLNKNVQQQLITQGLDLVTQTWKDNARQQTYRMSAEQFTLDLSQKLKRLVELQNYVIQYSTEQVLDNQRQAQWSFIITIGIIFSSISIILFMLIYIHQHIFRPLLCVQNNILALAEGKETTCKTPTTPKNNEFFSVFEALTKLKDMLLQRKRLEIELSQMANTDALTGLNNRLALEQYLQQELDQSSNLQHLALVVIDVDNFKEINDRYGHDIGDQALCWIAQQLKQEAFPESVVIRYGGDEFLLVCQNMSNEQLWYFAHHLKAHMKRHPLMLSPTQTLPIGISIGISLNQHSWNELFFKADQALLQAKLQGKNQIEFMA